MSFNRHITRNFNANKTNRIRYDDDDFRCVIKRFDKTYEMQYTPASNNVKMGNGVEDWMNGFYCYRSKNDKNLVLTFKYNAKEESSNYRIELLYANSHKKTTSSKADSTLVANADITINGTIQKE